MLGQRYIAIALTAGLWLTPGVPAGAQSAGETEPLRFPLIVVEADTAGDDPAPYREAALADLRVALPVDLLPAAPQPERRGTASFSYGRFYTGTWDVSHYGRSRTFAYDARLRGEKTKGERPHSGSLTVRPYVALDIPVHEQLAVNVECDYFDKIMDLPGPDTAPFAGATRHSVDARVAVAFVGKLDDHTTRLIPYGSHTLLNEDPSRPDYRNRQLGLKMTIEGVSGLYSLDLQQNRTSFADTMGIYRAHVQLPDQGVSDAWRVRVSADLFSQDGFGQRGAPVLDIFYDYDDDRYHQLSLGRTLEAFAFGPAYREENFIEVRPERLRPARGTHATYTYTTRISSQWRVRAGAYIEERKDRWYWADEDANGLYAPVSFANARICGTMLAAEYHRGDHFGYFATVDIRAVDSRGIHSPYVPYEPPQRISTGAQWAFAPRWRVHVGGEYEGRRYYNPGLKQRLEPFFMVQAKLTFQPKDSLTFFTIVDNVLNDHYQIVPGYSNQSRSAAAGVMARF